MKLKLSILLFSLTSSFVYSQTEKTTSYLNASKILQDALNALGGKERISTVKNIRIDYVAINHLRGQNVAPFGKIYSSNWKAYMIFDRVGNNIVNELKMQFPGGIKFHQRFIKKGSKAWFADLYGNMQPNQASVIPPGQVAALTRRVAPLWIYDIIKADTTFKWVGIEKFNGREQNVIEVKEGPQIFKIYFDSETKFPSKFENRGDDPLYGDQLMQFIFTGFKNVDGIMIPTGVLVKGNEDDLNYFTHLETQINHDLDPTEFEIPKGYTIMGDLPKPVVKEIGKNIYFIEDQIYGYNTTFVNFKDHIVVLEAPIGNAYSKVSLDMIAEKFPGKPVTQVLLSHYHADHSGGLPLYVSKGASLIVPDGIQSFLSAMLSVPHSIIPDPLKNAGNRVPTLKVINANEKVIIKDETMSMEIINTGAVSHSNAMLMVNFPKEKILWQADFIVVEADPGKLPSGFPINLEFKTILQNLNLTPQKIIGVHGRIATLNDIDELISNYKRTKAEL